VISECTDTEVQCLQLGIVTRQLEFTFPDTKFNFLAKHSFATDHGAATISRLLKIIGLVCKRDLYKR